MQEAKQDQKLTRLSVNLNAETSAALRSYADQRGLSFTESIRRMIAITNWIQDEMDAGRTVCSVEVEQGETRMRELVLL
jgi:hypothetical protein